MYRLKYKLFVAFFKYKDIFLSDAFFFFFFSTDKKVSKFNHAQKEENKQFLSRKRAPK